MNGYLECPACGTHEIAQVYGVLHEYGYWQEGWCCKECGEEWFTMDGKPFVPVDDDYGDDDRPMMEVVP